jgi:hypothetical protein
MSANAFKAIRAMIMAVTALALASCSGGGGGGFLPGSSGSSSPNTSSGSGGTTPGGGTGSGGTASTGGGGNTGGGNPGGGGGSSGGVTLLPNVTTPTAALARDALQTVGDAALVVGGTATTAGGLVPGSLGGSVVVLGINLDATGDQVRNMGDTLEATLLRVAALDFSPLVGTRGLLTPLLSDVGNTLRPLAGRSGELGSLTGPVWIAAFNTVNGLPNSSLSEVLLPLLNPVLTPLVVGPPSQGLLSGLLGNSNVLAGLPNRVGQTSQVAGTLNLGGVLAPVTGTVTAGNSAGLGKVLTPTNTTSGLLGTTSPSGSSAPSKGLLNGILRR